MNDLVSELERALAALGDPRRAESAAERLAVRLRSAAERVPDELLDRVAGLHDLSCSRFSGLGPLPVAHLRRAARAEIDRRGGEGWRALAPEHEGLVLRGALEGHDSEVRRLGAEAPGLLLSDAIEPTRVLWDLDSASERARPPRDDGFGAGWWVRRGPGERARAVDLTNRRPPNELALPPGGVAAVTATRLALLEGTSGAAAISVWEIASGRRVFRRAGFSWDRQSGDAIDLWLSPNGSTLALAAGLASSVTLVAVDEDRELASRGTVAGETETTLAALGPEPIALLRRADGIERLDLATGESRRIAFERPTAATLHPVNGDMAVGCAGAVALHAADGSPGWHAVVAGQIEQLGFDPRGETLGAVSCDGWRPAERGPAWSLAFWDRHGRRRGRIGAGRCFAFLDRSDPPGADLATGGRWGTIWLWRFAD